MTRLLLLLILGLVPAPPARAQRVETRITPTEWGIESLTDIRYGQVSLVYEDTGPRLVPYQFVSADGAGTMEAGGAFRSRRPGDTGGVFILSGFERGNQNSLGGYFSAFARAPSLGTTKIDSAPDGTHALEVGCNVEPNSFCGAWIHLFDTTAAPADRVFLDTSEFEVLQFDIWTEGADDWIRVKLADAGWEARQDAPLLGQLGEFTGPRNLAGGWRRVMIPLGALPGSVDRTRLASLIFEVVSSGQTRFWIRNAAFLTDADREAVFRVPPRVRPPKSSLAVWVWLTQSWLEDSSEAARSIRFLQGQGVDIVFLQIPDSPREGLVPGEHVLDVPRLAPLVASLTRAGMRTYALDGAPSFAFDEFHDGVVRTVRSVGEYNRAVEPESRFYGVRYDIEPYLLPGFHGPGRDGILTSYLSLVERISGAAREAGLRVGLDIPFWYDAPDPRTFRTVDIEWKGAVAPVSHHLIDMVDDVAIMAYRTMGYGPDGTIRHARDEVRYAGERGKDVFVALETSPLPDEILLEFEGEPFSGLPDPEDTTNKILLVSDGASTRMIFVPGHSAALPAGLRSAADPDSILWWPLSSRTPVPATKLTFDGSSAEDLRRVQEETAFELGKLPGFAGFAVHHAGSWRRLVR